MRESNKYITYKEIRKEYNFTADRLKKCTKKKDGNKNIYLKSDVEELFEKEKRKLEQINNLTNSSEWVQFSKIEDKKIKGKIKRAFEKDVELKIKNQILIGKISFVKKKLMDEVNSENFLKEQIYKKIENFEKEKYLLASEVKERYAIENYQLQNYSKGKIGRENFYLKRDIEKILNEKNKKIRNFESLKNNSEWMQFVEIKDEKLKDKIYKALRNEVLKKENLLIIESVSGKRSFVKKIFIEEVRKNDFWQTQKYKKITNVKQDRYVLFNDIKEKYGLTKAEIQNCYKEKVKRLNFYLESDVKKQFEEKKKIIELEMQMRDNSAWVEFTEIKDKRIKNKIRSIFQGNPDIKSKNQIKIKWLNSEINFIKKKFIEKIGDYELDKIVNSKDYITMAEIEELYEIPKHKLKNCNKKKIANMNFYYKEDIKRISEEREKKVSEAQSLIVNDEWILFTEIEDKKLQGRVERVLKKSDNLRKENTLIIEGRNGKRKLIKRVFLEEVSEDNFWRKMYYDKLDLNIKNDYIIAREIKGKYGLKNYEYKNCKKKIIGKTYFYLEKDLQRIVKERHEIEKKVKNTEDWIEIDKIDEKTRGKIKYIFRKDKEKREKYKVKIIGSGKVKILIKKEFIETIDTIPTENYFNGFNKLKIFDLNEFENILNKIKSIKKKFINKNSYSIETIKKYISEVELVSKEDVDRTVLEELMNKNGLYSIEKIGEVLKLSKKSMETLLKNQCDSRYIIVEDIVFFYEKDMEKFVLYIINKRAQDSVRRIEDIGVLLEERMKFFNDERYELKEYMHKYLKLKIDKDMKRVEVNRTIDALEDLYINIEKNLELYDDQELINFLKEKISEGKIKKGYIGQQIAFINNYRKIKKTLYKKELSGRVIYTKEKKKSELYSKEVWKKYYIRLTNIGVHIEMAKRYVRYAQSWLYCIENLFLVMRRVDILENTKNIFPEMIGILELKDINEVLEESKIDMILEQMEITMSNLKANKNKEEITFVVPSSIKRVFVIAYMICEFHRRNLDEKKIFFRFNGDICYKEKLFSDEELYNFSNLRCTKSIITYGYNYGIYCGNNNYNILSLQRSHKIQEGKISNTVAKYYLSKENEILEFIENLMEREAFGFIYYRIVTLFFENKEVDIKKLTQKMKIIKENIGTINLENFASKLIDKKEILRTKKDEIYTLAGAIENRYKDFDGFTIEVIKKTYIKNFKDLFGEIEINEKFIDRKIDRIKSIIDTKIRGKENFYKSFNDIFNNLHIIKEGVFCLYKKGEERNRNCKYIINGSVIVNCSMCDSSALTLVNLVETSENLKKIIKNMRENNESEILMKKYNHMLRLYLYILVEAYSFLGPDRAYYFKYLTDFENIKRDLLELRKLGVLRYE